MSNIISKTIKLLLLLTPFLMQIALPVSCVNACQVKQLTVQAAALIKLIKLNTTQLENIIAQLTQVDACDIPSMDFDNDDDDCEIPSMDFDDDDDCDDNDSCDSDCECPVININLDMHKAENNNITVNVNL
jgi:hypothetical protein